MGPMLSPIGAFQLARLLAGLPVNGARPTTEPEASLLAAVEAAALADRQKKLDQEVTALKMDVHAVNAQLGQVDVNAPPPALDPWTIYTLKDAYKPRPPLVHIIDGAVTVPSLVAVYGAPGSMKTMLTQDAMICVAAGIDWLPSQDPTRHTAKSTQSVPCLWLDFDNGTRRTHERFEALARARGLPDSLPLYYVSMPNPWLDCNDKTAVEELKQRIKRLGVQFVGVDNLGVISGDADENRADMAKVMANLRDLVETCQIAMLIIHHQRKAMSSTNGTRAGESLRGHTSIEAALDLALLVEREEQSEKLIIKSTKTRDVDVYPFGAEFDYTHRPGTKELETARFWGLEIDNPKSISAIEAAAIDIVSQQGPINRTMLVQAVMKATGAGRAAVRNTVDNLTALGTFKVTTGKFNAVWYEIP